jgi:hypothetical protein
VRWLHRRTKLPMLKSLFLTFISQQFLISSWYFCDSNKSFSLSSLGHGGVFTIVRRLLCLISSSSSASAPNNNLNGVKLVAV